MGRVKNYGKYNRKKRNSGSRVRKSVLLIATEGRNQTEKQYFKDFAKAQGRTLRFVPGDYTDPVNIAQATKRTYDKLELSPGLGDYAFCLIDADCDARKNNQISKADCIAKNGGFEILVSAPCFEVWYICHFTRSTRQLRAAKSHGNAMKEHCRFFM